MPHKSRNRENPLSQIATPAMLLLAAVLWTLLVLFSLWTQREQLNRTAMELARIDAIANLKKDMAIRKWASEVGGVYIKEDLAPNVDALSEQERVVAVRFTGESHKLISLTSIHILMGIQEISNKEYGSKERLTSLQLLNRKNAPDEWEAQALKTLEQGSKIVAESMPRKKGHGLMRVMIPMRMDEECLECHRETLVPVGGLRGGAAVTIDLNTYWTAQEPAWRGIQYWHTGIWFAGLAALLSYWSFVRRRAAEHMLIESERRENEVILQQHKQRLEESEIRLRELAAFLETVREEERTRIARELHDELGQALTALRFDLGWLRGKCGANASLGAPAAARVAAALGVVEQSIISLRRISEDLRPAMLDSLGLAAAVEHHVTQFAQRNGLPCRLQMNREEFELDGNLATAVFRIVQEALTNVARHAEASEVLIRIAQEETPTAGISLTVEDDGRGFDIASRTSRFGLLGMRERITMLGGTLDIDSQTGRGTRITAWLPLQKDSTP